MQRVQDLAEATADADNARLVYYWFGFNTLYGSWDSENREPLPDRGALRVFTNSLSGHDHDGLMPAIMREHKKLAESIVGDEYLNRAGAMRFNAAVAEYLDRFRNEPPAPEENLVQK